MKCWSKKTFLRTILKRMIDASPRCGGKEQYVDYFALCCAISHETGYRTDAGVRIRLYLVGSFPQASISIIDPAKQFPPNKFITPG